MARVKSFIEANVLDEAKRRLHHIMDTHDAWVVAFSGGKDSLVLLHLTHEVQLERGITTPVEVVFRDEEIIPDVVIDFVNDYRQLDWINLRWLCVPLKGTRMIMGAVQEYVQWDPTRDWVRPMPDWGLREADVALPDGTTVSQFTADDITAAPFPGKVCVLTGIRASESLERFRSCVNKLNENYLMRSGTSKRVALGKPLFDWMENDVFRFFYDRGLRYCPIYDQQVWAGGALRVSTMINVQTSKFLHVSKTYSPDLYENVMRVFPETATQERYYREMDRKAVIEEYGKDLVGVRRWIEKFITDPKQKRTALREFRDVVSQSKRMPENYPPEYVLTSFMNQAGDRNVMPMKDKKRGAAG